MPDHPAERPVEEAALDPQVVANTVRAAQAARQAAPSAGSAAYHWATARGFDLKAPHWDDLPPDIRTAVERIATNLAALRTMEEE